MANPVRFIVIGMQRSGTTVTHHCLRHHPQISCPDDEVLVSPFFTRGLSVFTASGRETFERRSAGHRSLFDAIAAGDDPKNELAHGLKVALSSYEEAMDLYIALNEHFPELRVVLVQRDDVVAQYGSLLLARKTGRWHRFGGSSRSSDAKIRVDKHAFKDYVTDCKRIRDLLASLGNTHEVLRFSYETDIAPGLNHRGLFGFLGVRELDPTWLRMRKVAPPPQEFMQDYDQLRQLGESLMSAPAAEPMPAVLDRVSATNDQEDSFFLVHRAMARTKRGWDEPAERDVVELIDRAPKLETWIAGRTHALAEHFGLGEKSLRRLGASDTESGAFLANRAVSLANLDQFADSLRSFAHAIQAEASAAEPWWLTSMLASAARLTHEGSAANVLAQIESEVGDGPATSVSRAVFGQASGDAAEARSSLDAMWSKWEHLAESLGFTPCYDGDSTD